MSITSTLAGALTRSPYRGLVTVDRHPSGRRYTVRSSPVPLHTADVCLAHGRWHVRVLTATVLGGSHPTAEKALTDAGLKVSALCRVDMRGRFSGAQRTLLGQVKCPRPTGRTPAGRTYCGLAAAPLSVWCPEHTPVYAPVTDGPLAEGVPW